MVSQLNIAITSTLCFALLTPPSWAVKGNCCCDAAKVQKSCCGPASMSESSMAQSHPTCNCSSSQRGLEHECQLSCQCSDSGSALNLAITPTWESNKSSLAHASFVSFLQKDAYRLHRVCRVECHSQPKLQHFRQALLCVWII
jgi:hypothetical protein